MSLARFKLNGILLKTHAVPLGMNTRGALGSGLGKVVSRVATLRDGSAIGLST